MTACRATPRRSRLPTGSSLSTQGLNDTTTEINGDGEEWHPHPLPDELVNRVTVVVNTHLHFDHCGGNRLFPGIPIHVQRRELTDARTENDYTVRESVDSRRDVRRARRRGGDPAGRQARAGAGSHGRASDRRGGDRRRRSCSAVTSATGSRSSRAGKRQANSSSSSSRPRRTFRMSPKCASRIGGRRYMSLPRIDNVGSSWRLDETLARLRQDRRSACRRGVSTKTCIGPPPCRKTVDRARRGARLNEGRKIGAARMQLQRLTRLRST